MLYLITGLLMTEREKFGSVVLKAFYLRRAGRLVPALLVLVTACSALGRSMVGRSAGIDLGSTVAAFFYLSDVGLYTGVLPVGHLSHTWSLAVEEHFYIVWPLLLAVLPSRRAVSLTSAALAAASFAWLIKENGLPSARYDLPMTYYAPHLRSWEILIGCTLAAAAPHLRARLARTHLHGAAWLATVAATLAVLSVPGFHIMSAWQSLAVGTATWLWLLASECDAPPVRLLALDPLAWIGRRTYSMYLYHYPVIGVLLLLLPGRSNVAALTGVTVSLVLAGLSFRFIEEPVRQAVYRRARSRLRPAGVQPATVR